MRYQTPVKLADFHFTAQGIFPGLFEFRYNQPEEVQGDLTDFIQALPLPSECVRLNINEYMIDMDVIQAETFAKSILKAVKASKRSHAILEHIDNPTGKK